MQYYLYSHVLGIYFSWNINGYDVTTIIENLFDDRHDMSEDELPHSLFFIIFFLLL